MSDKNYHPDGFTPMQVELFDGFKAMDRGVQFMKEVKGAFNVKEQNPMSHEEAEQLIAKFQGLSFAAIRAIEQFHGIL